MNNVIVRTLCAIAGLLCAGIGIIGMFVPVLPTTPLLLLAGFVLELVMLLLLYLMFVRIPTEKNTRSFRSAHSTQNAAE